MPSQGSIGYPWVSKGGAMSSGCFVSAVPRNIIHPPQSFGQPPVPSICLISALLCSVVWSCTPLCVAHQALNDSRFPIWDILTYVHTSTHRYLHVCKHVKHVQEIRYICTSRFEYTYFSAENENHCGHDAHGAC